MSKGRQLPLWQKKIFRMREGKEVLWQEFVTTEFAKPTNEGGVRTEVVPLNRRAKRISWSKKCK